jgi:hypothetical protein
MKPQPQSRSSTASTGCEKVRGQDPPPATAVSAPASWMLRCGRCRARATVRARRGWRVRLRVRRPVGPDRDPREHELVPPFGSGALHGPMLSMRRSPDLQGPAVMSGERPFTGVLSIARRRSIRAPRRSRALARCSYGPRATRTRRCAGSSCDGETRTRTGDTTIFRESGCQRKCPRKTCKSACPHARGLAAMPSDSRGWVRIWDFARGLKSQSP